MTTMKDQITTDVVLEDEAERGKEMKLRKKSSQRDIFPPIHLGGRDAY